MEVEKTTVPASSLILLAIDLGREVASPTVLGTIAEESALLAVDHMVPFVAVADADSTDSGVACESTGVAVIPVLLFVLLASA